MSEPCEHGSDFEAKVSITTLEGTGQAIAKIECRCKDCGHPFQFLGLEAGLDTQGARVSPDGLEARIAISPQGVLPSPLQRMRHGMVRLSS